MTFILIDDEQRCNNCVYWTGMRKKDEDFVYVDVNTAEWGICLHPNAASYRQPMEACEGCSSCTASRLAI